MTEEFVIKQSALVVLIVVLILGFITNDYACQNKMTEIERLKRELQDIKYENLNIATELTSHSRQSQVEELLKSKGSELTAPKTPAFEIEK